jgi:hypothetical protein
MLRRAWRRTSIGRAQDVFSFTSHKMLFGIFGLDPAGNVICLFQHRANQTAGSWGVVVHDSVSWPLHWYAMQQRHALRTEDIRGKELCRSVFVRRTYKFIRYIYLSIVAYCWFLVYLLVKQNAFNEEARIVLLELEESGVNFLKQKTVVSLFDDEQNTLVNEKISQFGKGARDVAFALAEDLGCFNPELDLDDRYQLNQKRKEALLARKRLLQKKEEERKANTFWGRIKREGVLQIGLVVVGAMYFVFGM